MMKEIMASGEAPAVLERILGFYALDGELKDIRSLGNGHINDTMLMTFASSCGDRRYVLQRINTSIFRSPGDLMENMVLVTEHLKRKIAERGGDPVRETLNIIPAANGSVFYKDEEGGCWRITSFVEGTSSCDVASTPEDMYITGKAFGDFQSLLSDFPAATLKETIPGFHDTRARYEGFIRTVEKNAAGRADGCRDEIDFILGRRTLARFAMDAYDAGLLPLRVTHNDTKINNLLIDDKTREAVCVIDLDTVMPGFAMNDFGDAIRTGACTAAEDEPDVSLVKLDLDFYGAFARGFLEGCAGNLTEYETGTLPMGALCITYEQALRFLADYLEGDVYYKTAYPEHNLVRARTQIKMVRELEAADSSIRRIVSACV